MFKVKVTYKSGEYEYRNLSPKQLLDTVQKMIDGRYNCSTMVIEKDQEATDSIQEDLMKLKTKIHELERKLG